MFIIEPIVKENLSDVTFDRILGMIIQENLKEGDKLPSESEICKKLEVGRNTVRTALSRLVAVGLISSVQGKGYYVRDVNKNSFINSLVPVIAYSSDDLVWLTQFRIGFEGQAASIAAENADEDDLRSIKKAIDFCGEHLEDDYLFAKGDMEFHLAVARASKNQIFYQIFLIIEKLYTVWLENFVVSHGKHTSHIFHTNVYEAIKRKDSEAAKKNMTSHMEDVLKKVYLDKEKEQSDGIGA